MVVEAGQELHKEDPEEVGQMHMQCILNVNNEVFHVSP